MSKFKVGDIVYRVSHSERIHERNEIWYHSKLLKIIELHRNSPQYDFYGMDLIHSCEVNYGYYEKDFIKLNKQQRKLFKLVY